MKITIRSMWMQAALLALTVSHSAAAGLTAAAIAADQNGAASAETGAEFHAARRLYDAGKYEEAAEYLAPYLRRRPDDIRAGLLVAGSQAKAGLIEDAVATGKSLAEAAATEQDRQAVRQLQALLDRMAAASTSREELIRALEVSDTTRALALVEKASYQPAQAQILTAYIHSYRGDFDAALGAAQKLGGSKGRALTAKLEEQRRQLARITSRLEFYLYSPLAASDWLTLIDDKAEFEDFKIDEYVHLVGQLRQLAPLHDWASDLSFHVALLSSKPDVIATAGDEILRTRGIIRVPFMAEDQFLNLVIDGRSKEIYTEKVDRPFVARYTWKFSSLMDQNKPKNGGFRQLRPFRFKWDAIPSFAQDRKLDRDARFLHGAGVLDFGSAGYLPTLGMLQVVAYRYGEVPAEQAIRNVGEFIAHLANPKLKPNLQSVGRGGGSWLAMTAAALAAGGGDTKTALATMRIVAQTEKENAQIAKQGATDWKRVLSGSVFDVTDQWEFPELDALLSHRGANH